MLLHAHPAKFAAEVLNGVVVARLLWRHDWRGAVAAGTLGFLPSTLLLWDKRVGPLAGTALGKLLLVYTTPSGFVLYNLSALPLGYGFWTHRLWPLPAGAALLLLPHVQSHEPAYLSDVLGLWVVPRQITTSYWGVKGHETAPRQCSHAGPSLRVT